MLSLDTSSVARPPATRGGQLAAGLGVNLDIGRASVTGWQWLRGLPLALVDSVVSLFAPLSGQNLVSVRDLYKREATSEHSFGFVFFPSGMASHSYLTRLAVSLGSASPPADQRPAAAQRRAPPNSDGSEDNDLTTQSARAAATEYDKLAASGHYTTLQKVEAAAEV